MSVTLSLDAPTSAPLYWCNPAQESSFVGIIAHEDHVH